MLIGSTGKFPEMRYTAQGMAIATFSLATNKRKKDKTNETQWHNCVCFGKVAEIVEQFVVKGSKLYVEGEIEYQVSEKDGVKKYFTKILVNTVNLLSHATDEQRVAGTDAQTSVASEPVDFDNDIPF